MKKIINWGKNNLPVIFISVIMGFVLDTMAETSLSSNSVSYSNNKTEETTVKGSLDELFNAVDINERLGNDDISSIGNGTVTGAINTMNTNLSKKQDTITGGATTIASSKLTANRALISSSNGNVAVSDTTRTELGYLSGVTSNVQTQINNINGNFDWKILAHVSGTTSINLPSDYNEIYVQCYTPSINFTVSGIYIRDALNSKTATTFIGGFYEAATSYAKYALNINQSSISILSVIVSNTDFTNQTTLSVFYR